MSPILGMDYGQRRIGLAISDPSGTLATALGAHRRDVDGPLLPYLQALIEEHQITLIVIGLPLTGDGREGEMAHRVRRFSGILEQGLQRPVVLIDERFSSQEATGLLRMGGRRRHDKQEVDALAAALILQQYLDRASTGGGEATRDQA